ncbi:hypothetical protein [Streptomyces sp. NPDC003952]
MSAARNDQTPDKGWLGFYLFTWPTWVFMAAFVVHVAFRLPRAVRAVRAGRGWQPAPDSEEAAGLVSPRPAPATISRRGALAMVGAGSLALLVVTAGQSIGGWWRKTAVLAPHGRARPHDAAGVVGDKSFGCARQCVRGAPVLAVAEVLATAVEKGYFAENPLVGVRWIAPAVSEEVDPAAVPNPNQVARPPRVLCPFLRRSCGHSAGTSNGSGSTPAWTQRSAHAGPGRASDVARDWSGTAGQQWDPRGRNWE